MPIARKMLRQIFDLMYKKLCELAIDNGFHEWINQERRMSFQETKKKGDSFLFENLAKTIFVGGFRSKIVDEKWPYIKNAFDDFDFNAIANYSDGRIEQIVNATGVIKNKRKILAIVVNAKEVAKMQTEYGSLADYIGSFPNSLSLAENLIERFAFLGNETVWDYLKSIGFEAIKPDIHVRRILFRLGLISDWKSSSETSRQVFEVANKISKETGERLNVIDAIIWFYGADRPKEIRKPICGTNPICHECYLTEYCKHFKSSSEVPPSKFARS
jgi:DNA-3-methyladenine glycosylase I